MAGVDPVGGVAGEQAYVHGPSHEADARVAGPEGAVAIKDRGAGLGGEDFGFELQGRETGGHGGIGWGIGQAGKLLQLLIFCGMGRENAHAAGMGSLGCRSWYVYAGMSDGTGEVFDNEAVAATRTTELIREYMTYLRVEKGLRPLSCAAYERDLLQFAEYLEGVNTGLLDARPEHISEFVQHLGRHGVESRSAARKLSCLRGFYKWLILDKRIARDPTLHQDSPSAWKVLPKALAPEEMATMLEQAKLAAEGSGADAMALRDRAILELLYAGGLRVSELTGLRVADLNLDAGRALVRGKGDKERVVPLGEPAVQALAEYLERGRPVLARHGRGAESALFLSARGRRLTRGWVWQLVRRYGASPHMLRHSAATHMVEHGADLRTVQTFLGHADISTTQVYTHVALGHLKAEHRKFHPRGRR